MDKRVIFAVAGSGKTTYIINSLSSDKRTLIVTYTVGNYNNLRRRIAKKFNEKWPENITVMTYFTFLYSFCYKPYYADKLRIKGLDFNTSPSKFLKKNERAYYISEAGYAYSNRFAFLLDNISSTIIDRLKKYFDEFIIDEVQDIAGRDFTFLEHLMDADMNMLFVGDFYQHTFDTSRDGNVNGHLFDDKDEYEARFANKGFVCDEQTLVKSWRCSSSICQFITENLGIEIYSNIEAPLTNTDSDIVYVSDSDRVAELIADRNIVKLHFRNGSSYGVNHKNWGETKGEDQYNDVCVLLNKRTAELHRKGKLDELTPQTRNKLYVAITRAHGKVYLADED